MSARRILGGALIALLAFLAYPVWGQRVRVPSPVSGGTATTGSQSSPGWTAPRTTAQPTGTGVGNSTSVYAQPNPLAPNTSGAAPVPSVSSQAPSTYAPGTAGTTAPPSTYAPPGALSPPSTYAPPPASTVVPPGAPGSVPGVAQPPAAWDPYAIPGSQQPTLLPQDPYLPSNPIPYPGGAVATMTRFMQEIRFDYVFIPGTARNELGFNSVDLSATFALPFLYNTQTPLLITPGFALHMWNGPETDPFAPGYLPPRTYDAYLDAAWNPQLSPVIGGELGFRIGVYSDFRKVVEESLRFQGHGLAVVSFSPAMQIKAGVMYLDRIRIKLLPAGGIVWTPNPDVRFEILFPNPRIARRLWTRGNTDWWIYVRGEYGGGNWTIEQSDVLVGDPPVLTSYRDEYDYNDIRVGLGLEFDTPKSWKGLFEVGVTCDRELRFKSEIPRIFRPDPTVYLRAALAY